MATADEVFSAMEGTSTEDRYAIIDNDLRTITIPDSIPYLGVMSDDSVLKLPFKMPATYCGFDLSEFTVYINYVNASNIGDRYRTNDVTKLDDGHLTFSWIVGRNAVSKVGNVKFIVCMRKYDEDNITVIQEFNTTICTMPVLPGLETDEQAILPYNDLVNELVTKWQGEIDTAVNRANAIPTYIPSVSTNGIISWRNDKGAVNPKSVNIKGPRGEKGDPGVGTIADIQTGSLIHMENACPESEILELTIYGKSEQASTTGKNLLEMVDGSNDQYGVSCSISDGVISLSGTSAIESAFGAMFPETNIATILVPGETYTVSINGKFDSSYFQCNQIKDGHETELFSIGPTLVTSKYTFTVDEDVQIMQVFVGIIEGKPTVNDKFSIQIELGSTATSYEPYTGGKPSPSPDYPQEIKSIGAADVVSFGANALPPTSESAKTSSGLTATPGADGSYVVSGTCTTETAFNFNVVPFIVGPDMRLSLFNTYTNDSIACGLRFTDGTYYAPTIGSANVVRDMSGYAGKTVNIVNIYINSPGTALNFTLKPMLCHESDVGEFVPYNPASTTTPVSLTAEDGTVYELRSLPDGTRDEVNAINGRKVLVKRVEELVLSSIDASMWAMQRQSSGAILYYTSLLKGLFDYSHSDSYNRIRYMSNFAQKVKSLNDCYFGCVLITHNSESNLCIGANDADGTLHFSNNKELAAWLEEVDARITYKLITPETIDLGPADPIVLPEQISNVWTTSDPSTDMQAEWFTTDGKQVWKLYSLFHSNMTESEIDDAVAEGIPQGLGDITDEEIIEAVIGGLSNG